MYEYKQISAVNYNNPRRLSVRTGNLRHIHCLVVLGTSGFSVKCKAIKEKANAFLAGVGIRTCNGPSKAFKPTALSTVPLKLQMYGTYSSYYDRNVCHLPTVRSMAGIQFLHNIASHLSTMLIW